MRDDVETNEGERVVITILSSTEAPRNRVHS